MSGRSATLKNAIWAIASSVTARSSAWSASLPQVNGPWLCPAREQSRNVHGRRKIPGQTSQRPLPGGRFARGTGAFTGYHGGSENSSDIKNVGRIGGGRSACHGRSDARHLPLRCQARHGRSADGAEAFHHH